MAFLLEEIQVTFLLFRKNSKSSMFLFNKQDRQNVENFVQIL